MAYGFSVFWLPLSRSIGINQPAACSDLNLLGALFTTSWDWRVADLGCFYTLFFVLLGSSAALWGGWLERVGPRKAGLVSAPCWCGGITVAASARASRDSGVSSLTTASSLPPSFSSRITEMAPSMPPPQT